MIAFLVLSICGYVFQFYTDEGSHVFSDDGVYLCDLESEHGTFNILHGTTDAVICSQGDKKALYNLEGHRVSKYYDELVETDNGIAIGYNIWDMGDSLQWGVVSSGGDYEYCSTVCISEYTWVPFKLNGLSADYISHNKVQYIRLFGQIGDTKCLTLVFHIDGTEYSSSSYNCTNKVLEGGSGSYISVYTASSSSPINQRTCSILDECGNHLIGPIQTSFGDIRIHANNYCTWENKSEDILILYDNTGSEIYRGPSHVGYSLHVFQDGLYPCRGSNGLYGYMNEMGEWHITPQFQEASSFSSGLAGVKTNDLWGYINTEGEIAIPIQYDSVRDFIDGYGVVIISNIIPRKQRAIDSLGNYIGDEYYSVLPLGEGLFKVETGNPTTYALMDALGNNTIPFTEMAIQYH